MSEVKLLGERGAPPVWSDIELRHQRQPMERLYLLVDGALNEKLLKRIERRWPGLAWHSIFEQLPEGAWPECSPLLLPVDFEDENANEDGASSKTIYGYLLAAKNVAPESTLVIWSESPTQDLARHLGQYAQVKIADDQRAILRFYDSNIWPAWLSIMDAEQAAHFKAPWSEVWRPDLDNVWWTYPGAGKEMPPPIKEHRWTEKQQTRFAELIQPRKILSNLEDEHGELITGSRAGWLDTLRGWVDAAKKSGADRPGTQTLYCTVALLVGSDFAQDAIVAAELEGIGSRHTSFQAAIAAVPPDTWDRLANRHAAEQGLP